MTELEELLAREIDAGSFPGAVALVGTSEAVLEVAAAGRSLVEPEQIPDTPRTV